MIRLVNGALLLGMEQIRTEADGVQATLNYRLHGMGMLGSGNRIPPEQIADILLFRMAVG